MIWWSEGLRKPSDSLGQPSNGLTSVLIRSWPCRSFLLHCLFPSALVQMFQEKSYLRSVVSRAQLNAMLFLMSQDITLIRLIPKTERIYLLCSTRSCCCSPSKPLSLGMLCRTAVSPRSDHSAANLMALVGPAMCVWRSQQLLPWVCLF